MPRKAKKEVQKISPLRNRVEIVWKNLVVFLILFIFSFVLYSASSSALFLNLFGMLSIIFGFVSFALLIVLIVFLILKAGAREIRKGWEAGKR